MSKKIKAGRKRPQKKRQSPSLSKRESNALMSVMRLVYCWRYVDHARANRGEPLPEANHGYNLLIPDKPEKVDAAYALATNRPMHWQVLVVGYVVHGEDEYRSWAWVKSEAPIVAAGDGITPLLAQANDQALDDLEEGAECFGRGVIMAPLGRPAPDPPQPTCGPLENPSGALAGGSGCLERLGRPGNCHGGHGQPGPRHCPSHAGRRQQG